MSGPTSESHERLSFGERRAVIFDVAAQVLAANGYDRASMRDIAKGAGVTTPVLYDHFRSKTDLYRQVVEEHAAKLIASWSQTPVETTTPEELFIQANVAFFGWIRDNQVSWRILFLDQPCDPKAVEINRQVRRMAEVSMAQMLAALPGLRLPGSVGPETAVQALAAQVTGAGNALSTWWADRPDLSVDTLVELNHALVWQGLKGLLE